KVYGSSPPTVFVGRNSYPKIFVYPSTPPVLGDTSHYEDPKFWLNSSLNDFLSIRLSLIRGGIKYHVDSAKNPDKLLLDIQTLAISSRPTTVELSLRSSPSGRILDENLPPLGPSAPLEKLRIDDLAPPLKIVERVYTDDDLKAKEGIITLYNHGVDVEKIAKILSVGGLGVRRRLVPTRWSITAVDKTVSDDLVRKIRQYESIDKIEVYVRSFRNNLFLGILLPGYWSFEWGEAWFPGSTWNKWGNNVEIEIDNEGYRGREDYPEIGGCYYASRLAAAEFLLSRRRQAVTILWREIYEGFYLPIGVWFVRENIRELFKQKPRTFDRVEDALSFVRGIMRSDINLWLKKSLLSREDITRWLK
ncbi:MAG: Nre family DNA repair protein, partial [Sulfolobaceae archaeon]